MAQDIITATGSGTWTALATTVVVECWGGGGGGAGATLPSFPSTKLGGGGSGAYSKKTLTVTLGASINLFVGAGGSGAHGASTNGGDTWFNTSGTVIAKGGEAGTIAGGGNGGGSSGGNIGDLTRVGQNGGAGGPTTTDTGGGGGGSPGVTNTGSAGATGDAGGAGGAGASPDGANGGNGGTVGNVGSNGSAPGGGGGGSGSGTNLDGGNGGNGKIIITYTPAQTATPGVGTVTITGVSPSPAMVAHPGVGTVAISSPGVGASGASTIVAIPGVATVTISGASSSPTSGYNHFSVGGEGAYSFGETFSGSSEGGVSGQYRIANDIAGYTVRVGVGALPDLDAPPDAYAVSLPVSVAITPPGAGTQDFYVIVRKRDHYGLESQNQFPEIFTIDSAGKLVKNELLPPENVKAFARQNGGILVKAEYPNFDVDRYPADRWKIHVSWTDGGPLTYDEPPFEVTTGSMSRELTATFDPGLVYTIDVSLFRTSDSVESDPTSVELDYPNPPSTPRGVYSGPDFPNI